jgi:hypothetical protein
LRFLLLEKVEILNLGWSGGLLLLLLLFLFS